MTDNLQNPHPGESLYPEEIFRLPMFYPSITKEEGEDLLLQPGLGDGAYLIRPNRFNDPSFVSISIRGRDNQVYKVKVNIGVNGQGLQKYYIVASLEFGSMDKLLYYYQTHQIYTKERLQVKLYLLYPLNKHKVGKVKSQSQCDLLHPQQEYGTSPETLLRGRSVSNITPPDSKRLVYARNSLPENNVSYRKSETLLPLKKSKDNSKNRGFLSKLQTMFKPCAGKNASQSLYYTDSDQGLDLAITDSQRDSICSRAPQPLPRVLIEDFDPSFYYSTAQSNKKCTEELYNRLKQSERCECGLHLSDSRLANGWDLHRCNEGATEGMIFFQNGDETRWDIPEELLPFLTERQINLMLFLCKSANRCIPATLSRYLKDKNWLKKHMKAGQLEEANLPYVFSSSSNGSSSSGVDSGQSQDSATKRPDGAEHNFAYLADLVNDKDKYEAVESPFHPVSLSNQSLSSTDDDLTADAGSSAGGSVGAGDGAVSTVVRQTSHSVLTL